MGLRQFRGKGKQGVEVEFWKARLLGPQLSNCFAGKSLARLHPFRQQAPFAIDGESVENDNIYVF
ncbi:MAG: hypothetical protein CM15mV74_510 [uncultured marine virus]|nr:MAG: hypothetical protein CM15mV74_510 [uncultured marine virus]